MENDGAQRAKSAKDAATPEKHIAQPSAESSRQHESRPVSLEEAEEIGKAVQQKRRLLTPQELEEIRIAVQQKQSQRAALGLQYQSQSESLKGFRGFQSQPQSESLKAVHGFQSQPQSELLKNSQSQSEPLKNSKAKPTKQLEGQPTNQNETDNMPLKKAKVAELKQRQAERERVAEEKRERVAKEQEELRLAEEKRERVAKEQEELLFAGALCCICGKVEVKSERCEHCYIAQYCSLECRQTDEVAHSLVCASLKDFAVPDVENPSKVAALLFPWNEDKPRFVWLDVEPRELNSVDRLAASANALINRPGGDVADLKFSFLPSNTMRQRRINKKRVIWMATLANQNPQMPNNRSLMLMTEELKKAGITAENLLHGGNHGVAQRLPPAQIYHHHAGHVVFYTHDMRACETLIRIPISFDYSAYRNVVDNLYQLLDAKSMGMNVLPNIIYRPPLFSVPLPGHPDLLPIRAETARLVRGIRINCLGDTMLGLKRIETAHFPQDHPIFQKPLADRHSVLQVLGVACPFKIMPVPLPCIKSDYLRNDTFEFLMRHWRPDSQWNKVLMDERQKECRMQGRNVLGSYQIVRFDGKDIHSSHLKAIVQYLEDRAMNNDASKVPPGPKQYRFVQETMKGLIGQIGTWCGKLEEKRLNNTLSETQKDMFKIFENVKAKYHDDFEQAPTTGGEASKQK